MTQATRAASRDWVNGIVAPAVVIMMEACWLYAWFIWLGRWSYLAWQRPPLSLATVIFLLGASFIATRFFLGRRWAFGKIQAAIIGCGLLAVIVATRLDYGGGYGLLSTGWFGYAARLAWHFFSEPNPLVIAPFIGVYLWWRGIALGRSLLSFDDVYRSFALGFVALIALLLICGSGSGTSSFQGLTSTIGIEVAGFFFFGLTALALANLKEIRERLLQGEGVSSSFSRRWLYVILLVIGGITLVGIGIATIFSADFVSLITKFMSLAYQLLISGITYIFVPIGFIVALLVYIARLLASLVTRAQVQPFSPQDMMDPDEAIQYIAPRGMPAGLVLGIKIAALVLIIAVIVYFLAGAIFRMRARKIKSDIEEVHESLFSWAFFKKDLALLFGMLLQFFRRKKKEAGIPAETVPEWYTTGTVREPLSIREMYRNLLWTAANARLARRDYETPGEYARRVGRAVPEGSQPLHQFTRLYLDVRYGEIPADDAKVQTATRLWRELRRVLTGSE